MIPHRGVACQIEGCESAHCRQCARHYLPALSEGGDRCDACQVDQVMAECRAITRAFGGNAEAAAAAGWL